MNRFFFATLATLASLLPFACVPASEPRPPAGAAGFVTMPSAAARGEPFTTSDGWTIAISKLIVQANVNAMPAAGEDRPETWYGGSTNSWLFDGSKPALMYARELAPGAWQIGARLDGSYVSLEYESDYDDVVNLGVSPADEARFRRFVDVGYGPYVEPGDTYGPGPSVAVVLHAEKEGRTVDLDLSFGGFTGSNDRYVSRQVRADAVDVGPLEVRPERLFASGPSGVLRFDSIAAADTDGDGRLTAAEVMAAPRPEGAEGETTYNLGDTLVVRSKNILVLP